MSSRCGSFYLKKRTQKYAGMSSKNVRQLFSSTLSAMPRQLSCLMRSIVLNVNIPELALRHKSSTHSMKRWAKIENWIFRRVLSNSYATRGRRGARRLRWRAAPTHRIEALPYPGGTGTKGGSATPRVGSCIKGGLNTLFFCWLTAILLVWHKAFFLCTNEYRYHHKQDDISQPFLLSVWFKPKQK